ncbi:MAG: site-specific integrase [Anaeromyxobacteraceae bacterium]
MARPTRHRGKWRIRWFDENDRRRSEVYEKLTHAKSKLREHELKAEEIRLGIRSPDPAPRTFDDAADYWLKHRAVNKRSRACDESILRVHLRPFFGGMKLARIGVQQVDEFSATKTHLHKNTLHHVLTLLISLLHLAVELDWLRKLPKIKKPSIKLFTKDFHYLRNGSELIRFLRAAHDEGDLAFALYATAVFTGLRQGELAALRWSEVNLEKRLISVEHSWHGPTKTGEVRYVPILDPLLPVLQEWHLKCPGEFVFPNRDGRMFSKCARIFQETFHDILDRAGFPKVERHGRTRRYIRFHDLRHTFASHWMMNSGDLFRLQSVLGHKSPLMTMRYAHLAPDAFEQDHARLGGRLDLEDAPVVELRPKPAQ